MATSSGSPAGPGSPATAAGYSGTPLHRKLGDPRDLAALERRLPTVLPRVTEAGRLWLCWPKRASGVASDLDDNVVRGRGLATGMVDVKVCAVDQTWSGLCLMTRLADRRAGAR